MSTRNEPIPPGRIGVMVGAVVAIVGSLGPRWHVLQQASSGTEADFFLPLLALLCSAAVVVTAWKAPAAAGVALLIGVVTAVYGITESMQFSDIAAKTSLIRRGWGLPTIVAGGVLIVISSLTETSAAVRNLTSPRT